MVFQDAYIPQSWLNLPEGATSEAQAQMGAMTGLSATAGASAEGGMPRGMMSAQGMGMMGMPAMVVPGQMVQGLNPQMASMVTNALAGGIGGVGVQMPMDGVVMGEPSVSGEPQVKEG